MLTIPCIIGPTGAGKTAAALALAASSPLPVSIVNIDSRQIYKDFPLITAQPSIAERGEIPHLLYGFMATEEKMGAGEYARIATETIKKISASGRLPLLVGGTGLYMKALFEGMAPIPEVSNHVSVHWREECDEKGSPALYAVLEEYDPDYAKRIHPNDRQRITRALEVWQATGKTFSWWHAQPVSPPPFRAVKIGVSLPMPELEPRLKIRVKAMLADGAEEEARAALEVCRDPDAPGWSGIGCREMFLYLTGRISIDECLDLWVKNTRAYAKRQMTWFRGDKEITWFRPEEIEKITNFVFQASSLL